MARADGSLGTKEDMLVRLWFEFAQAIDYDLGDVAHYLERAIATLRVAIDRNEQFDAALKAHASELTIDALRHELLPAE